MSKIEWTDVTWNPIRRVGGGHACEKVSPGCKHCYAERMQPRFGNGRGKYDGKGEICLDERVLTQPLRWRKPRMVFVCSMSDLFWEKVPDDWIHEVFSIMEQCSQHTFQVLTKRARRMCDYVQHQSDYWGDVQSLPNVWLGVSAENQKYWDERVPWLVKTPAAVRFVSCEPLLGSIDATRAEILKPEGSAPGVWLDALRGCYLGPDDIIPDHRIHWIIAGGESGPGARPSHPDWFRSLRDQCQAVGVPFFFKQWGEHVPDPAPSIPDRKQVRVATALGSGKGAVMRRVGKEAAGRLLDGREWSEMPQIPR